MEVLKIILSKKDEGLVLNFLTTNIIAIGTKF